MGYHKRTSIGVNRHRKARSATRRKARTRSSRKRSSRKARKAPKAPKARKARKARKASKGRTRFWYLSEPPFPRERFPSAGAPAGYYKTKTAAKAAYKGEHPIASQYEKRKTLAGRQLERQAERSVEHVVTGVAKKAAPLVVGAAPVAAAAVSAGLAAFILADAANHTHEGVQLRVEAANRAYRLARQKLEQKLGHFPSKSEVAPLTAAWKKATAEALAYTATSRAGVY